MIKEGEEESDSSSSEISIQDDVKRTRKPKGRDIDNLLDATGSEESSDSVSNDNGPKDILDISE